MISTSWSGATGVIKGEGVNGRLVADYHRVVLAAIVSCRVVVGCRLIIVMLVILMMYLMVHWTPFMSLMRRRVHQSSGTSPRQHRSRCAAKSSLQLHPLIAIIIVLHHDSRRWGANHLISVDIIVVNRRAQHLLHNLLTVAAHHERLLMLVLLWDILRIG